MIRCYVTDRRSASTPLAEIIGEVAREGVDWIQIREKDLEGRELAALVRQALEAVHGTAAHVLVNDRADVALACGAWGVHLRSGAPPPSEIRKLGGKLHIGVSCHSADEVRRAAGEGADYALLAPIFYTSSKPAPVSPLGLDVLREAAKAVRIPVLALGGISAMNIPLCLNAGAAGVAGISMFQAQDR